MKQMPALETPLTAFPPAKLYANIPPLKLRKKTKSKPQRFHWWPLNSHTHTHTNLNTRAKKERSQTQTFRQLVQQKMDTKRLHPPISLKVNWVFLFNGPRVSSQGFISLGFDTCTHICMAASAKINFLWPQETGQNGWLNPFQSFRRLFQLWGWGGRERARGSRG